MNKFIELINNGPLLAYKKSRIKKASTLVFRFGLFENSLSFTPSVFVTTKGLFKLKKITLDMAFYSDL